MGSRGSQSLVSGCGQSKRARVHAGLRAVPDIGMFAVDNSVAHCKWRTEACKDCYNRKMLIYKDFKKAWSKGGKDDKAWENIDSNAFKGLSRVRLNTRGEPFYSVDSIKRIGEWVKANPNTLFWIPTRAWQTGLRGSRSYVLNMEYIDLIEKHVMCHPNARVMASIDDYTRKHWRFLADRGWSTMFFSAEKTDIPGLGMEGSEPIKCRKTWDRIRNPDTGRWMHRKGVCRTCKKGCFSSNRVDVWLAFH